MRRFGAALGLALVLGTLLPGRAEAASIVWAYPVGNEPYGVTIDPSDGRLYVANSDHGSSNPGVLSVVDPALTCSPSSCPRTEIALESPPTMSALDRGLGRLFVTTADRTLAFVDIASQSVVNTVPNAGSLGVAVDEATHHVYAAAVTSLSMVDGDSGAVLHTAAAGPGDSWWAVALDAGAHRVYVTNLDTSAPSLVVLDADDLSFVREVPLPEVPRLALAVDAARQRVYVAGFSGAGRLYVVDPLAGVVTASVDLQAGASRAFSATLVAAEDRLYLSQLSGVEPKSNGIVILDLATLQVAQRIPLPWQPGQTALHANGLLYVAAFSDQRLAAISMNSAPVIDTVSLSPSSPRTNDVIQATVVAHDADGDPLTYSYEWLRNGAPIADATGSSLDLSAPGHGDRDDTITVRVIASDGQATSAPATASVVVSDTAPTASVALDSASPATDQVITATATSSDADGDAITYTFTWKVDGGVRSVVSGPSASASFDLGAPGNGDHGQTVSVDVVASDGTLQSVTSSASAVVANSSPTVAVSLSDTTPRSNDVLVATASAQDADADPLTLTYAWSVDGDLKQTGASDSFDLRLKGNGANGDLVTVVVTASDGAASATASASATVTPGNKH